MLKKLSVFLFLCALILTACEPRPYGHYKDDEMIGKVYSVDLENNMLDVDISEWSKRHLRGDINSYGVSLMVTVTDDLVIKKEDGQQVEIDQVKLGQKVLVNPPKSVRDEHYEAEEVILLEMTYEEKFDQLLSDRNDRYRTTVFVVEGGWIPKVMEAKIRESGNPYGIGNIPENYVVNYEAELDIEKYPVILVFDDKELVLKTYDVEEYVTFFDSLPNEADS